MVEMSCVLSRLGHWRLWRYGVPGVYTEIPAATLGEDAWQFADSETRALFDAFALSSRNG